MNITYQQYYTKMKAIEKFLNAASFNDSVINVTGLSETEAMLYRVGKYIQQLSSATLPSFYLQKCNIVITILVNICRSVNGKFDFKMFTPEEMEDDRSIYDLWKDELVEYSRMSGPILVGKAALIPSINDIAIHECAYSQDIEDWCNVQAIHLAAYCIAHDYDLTQAIDII